MYFLSKVCRICIQTGETLLDLDTVDFDDVKLSDKLQACTKTVSTDDKLPTEICMQCIEKLRISYQLQEMYKKSTKILQGYLNVLICGQDDKVTSDNFINTELSVVVTPLQGYDEVYKDSDTVCSKDSFYHRERRKRITKEQRCSLLKRLLMPSENTNRIENSLSCSYYNNPNGSESFKGLKNIINFTKNYEFGDIRTCELDRKLDKNSNYELTPLDKLKAFSIGYFSRDFSAFKNTILYWIENKDNYSENGSSDYDDEEEDCYNILVDSKDTVVKFEEVIVEPDVKIKTEVEYEDEGEYLSEYGVEYQEEEPTGVKQEPDENLMDSNFTDSNWNWNTPIPPDNEFDTSSSSMQVLNNFVGSFAHKRTFSPSNVRCRTRNNPYINPLLKAQFLNRSFRCTKCSRYFKSPGYLKAHYSKVH